MLAILLVALAACEFRPLYGQRSATHVEDRLAQVSVGIIANRTGQLLRNELHNRLDPNNRAPAPLYRLEVELSESLENLALRRDATVTRAKVTTVAQYRLTRLGSDDAIAAGSVRSVNSYDILPTEKEFSTRTAEQEARQRATSDLASQIAVRLSLALDRLASRDR